jgi:hypothetical protein
MQFRVSSSTNSERNTDVIVMSITIKINVLGEAYDGVDVEICNG